jgi:dihydroorotate dehydrogenase (fumarate)
MQEAGADALELNVYSVATDFNVSGTGLEKQLLSMVRSVKQQAKIPVAVKLSPFFTSVSHLAKQLDEIGVDGLVLFNRFYQPDIDPEALEVVHSLRLSNSSELLLRLRWLAILSGRTRASLAVTGGVHDAMDVLKSVMAGAHAVQVVSLLLQRGPEQLGKLKDGLEAWLVEHEYESLKQAQGSMSLLKCPDPGAFERGNYVKILQTWGS